MNTSGMVWSVIFMEVEPLGGKRHVEITQSRTKIDWANFVKDMLDTRYPDAQKVILVMGNLNTHSISSLYQAFPAEQTHRLANCLEIHHTPKHGSWLNTAEIELSVYKRQCLNRRIPTIKKLVQETEMWNRIEIILQIKSIGSLPPRMRG